jgi:glycosyltransferase involved in cell wall biosynthesis
MSSLPTVSVIIPTYNRDDMLSETLDSLAQQTYPCDCCEVIVVDDGSTDATGAIAGKAFPFTLRYFWQRNQGDAVARNFGAQQSNADYLVFLDDDILLETGYLTCLMQAHDTYQNRIVVGTTNLWQAETTTFSRSMNASLHTAAYHAQVAQDSVHSSGQIPTTIALPFREAYSNNMSLGREAYIRIGMMQGLEYSGSSMWCDLDFAYRAYRHGFEFYRSTMANCWHRDHTTRDLDTYKRRVRTASYRAVVLFKRYPELLAYIPMFHDKTPILWSQDAPRLIARKIVRAMASSRPSLWGMEHVVNILEKRDPASGLLPPLYRYIIGGHTFQGYRAGLSASSHRRRTEKVQLS